MSEKKEDGGPAFPVVDHMGDGWNGMTLRDYAVIKLAAAMTANSAWPSVLDWEEIISRAALGADIFLAERAKSGEGE